jgi:uncharacterized membrane protein YtjA (UPF0391 family)
MARVALVFFILAILAIVLGAAHVGGVSLEMGRTLLIVFLILAVLSFLANLAGGHGTRPPLGS